MPSLVNLLRSRTQMRYQGFTVKDIFNAHISNREMMALRISMMPTQGHC